MLVELAQGSTNEALNTINILITGAVTIIVTWLTVQRSRDKKESDKRHEVAVVERKEIAKKAAEVKATTEKVAESVKPTNGYTTLGEALQALEERVQEMGERLARGDARFDNMEENEQRIAEQLAIVSQANTAMLDKMSEILGMQGQLRTETRAMAESVSTHHHAWDDEREDGQSLLDWVEQAKLREAQAKRKKWRQ